MRIDQAKSPQAGDDVPQEKTELSVDMESVNSNHSRTNSCVGDIRSDSVPRSAYQTNKNSVVVDGSNTDNVNNTSSTSRPHVKRSRTYLHRCPFNHCRDTHSSRTGSKSCRNSHSHSSSRHTTTGNTGNFSIPANIPLETADTTTLQGPPSASRVPGWSHKSNDFNSSCHFGYYIISSLDNSNSHNNGTNANLEGNARREMISRGVHSHSPLPLNPHHQLLILQQQQQQQQQHHHLQYLRVHTHDRKRAINCMMTHLQLRGSENDEAHEVVRKRIEKLEEQVFASTHTKDQYVDVLASKLGAIMERLYNSGNSRKNRPQFHTPPHPQPAAAC